MRSIDRVLAGTALALILATGASAQDGRTDQSGGTDDVAGPAIPPPGARGEAGWVEVVAGPRYDAGPLHRVLLGDGWREVWLAPIRVPVLDLATFAGGLIPEKQGGGNQSITLHFVAPGDREYIFRSTDKHIAKALPEDLQGTIIGEAMQDVIGDLYPAGAIAVSELLDATDILHVRPWPVVMPDDPALGEFRETFAGMLGTIEETPNEAEGDVPTFENSRTVAGSETFLEHLEETPEHRPDAAAFVKARLFDYIINDTDRGADQWRWARYDAPPELQAAGVRYVWQPVPRDRDWAFVDAGGWLVKLAATGYPKLVEFDPGFPSSTALNFSSWPLDRELMPEATWQEWETAVRELQSALTDDVIEGAVQALPEGWVEESGAELVRVLKSRRDRLMEPARTYYQQMMLEPEVHATDLDDRAEVVRQEDGSVDVRLYAADATTPYFQRRFVEDESHEIRLYMHGGDDEATVRGPAGADAIVVRVIGGGGDDTLVDAGTTRAWHARTVLLDHRGENELRGGESTAIITREYEEPDPTGDWIVAHTTADRDWGNSNGFSPRIGYGEGAGIILGGGFTHTRYGFRAKPHLYRVGLDVLYATRDNSFGVRGMAETMLRNSNWSLSLTASGVQYDALRFYGYGNETEVPGDLDQTLVMQDRVQADVAAVWRGDEAWFSVGPTFSWMDPRYDAGAPIALRGPLGAQSFAQVGGALRAGFERAAAEPNGSTFRAALGLEGYPGGWDLPDEFAAAEAQVSGVVPLPLPLQPALAARVGGRHAMGSYPVQEAAAIGGRETLRGYRFQRFTGESSAYGSVELRLPLVEIELLTRGRLGVLGLADVGRVWVDDETSDVWHDAFGGGLWFSTVRRTFAVTYAYGEEGRLYLNVGMPF